MRKVFLPMEEMFMISVVMRAKIHTLQIWGVDRR